MDDARTGAPKSRAILGGGVLEELVDFHVLFHGLDQVDASLDPCLDEVVAVDGRGDCDALAHCLHKVEHDRLAEDVLERDAVGVEGELAHSRLNVLVLGVDEVSQEDFIGQSQRSADSLANDI